MTVSTMLSLLSEGFVTSLLIFVLTLLFSMPLGLAVMFGRRSRLTPLRGFIKAYISIMRGTPLMLQLMVVFYGPKLLLGVTVPGNWRFTAVIVAFVINYAAYFAEIYRGGIESIPRGQYEAAQVLGYTKAQTFFKIILPQMVKRVIPAVTNEVITLVKDTSLASVIGTVEMFTRQADRCLAEYAGHAGAGGGRCLLLCLQLCGRLRHGKMGAGAALLPLKGGESNGSF